MSIFENQYNLRVSNQLKVISILKKGETSLSDIATSLKVSGAATTKIVNQLSEYKIVKKQSVKPKGKAEPGRLPISVKLNESVGVTCAIAFAKKTEVALATLTGKIIAYDSFETNLFIGEEEFKKVSQIIKELLKKPAVNNRPLLGICISAPGMVQKETGDIFYSFKMKTGSNCSPLAYFRNEFGVPTNLYNDVQIGMVGAKKYGLIPNDANNFLYAHIDSACGEAFSFEGKLYQGFHGYPGEQTSYDEEDEYSKSSTSNVLYGYAKIAKYAEDIDPSVNYYLEDLTPDKFRIIEDFKNNNKVIKQAVEKTAIKNALQLIAYDDLLNFDYIIIEGGINRLGDEYKNLILNSIYKYRKKFRTNIIFLHAETNPSLLGAIYQSGNIYFLEKLEKITNQRSTTGKYNIADAFGENI